MSSVVASETGDEPIGPMSWEEFLAFEAAADRKHEYVGGFAWPWGDGGLPNGLAGASRRHNTIAGNVFAELWTAARARRALGCRALGSDMLLRVGGVAYYPDVQLVCDPTDDHERYTQRPCLVVEVVSPSTMRRDYGEKLRAYQTIPTLQAYLLISQDEPRVLRWWRSDHAAWFSQELREGTVPVPCLGLDLSLEAIYTDIP